ncbi:MAG: HlyC/CorC family transporter [Acidimicrobiia bacterium]|nr:HlyC/CorC family transporter [Acidimicrobiia bacterium]
MTYVALAIAFLSTVLAAAVRAAGASLVRTPRAEALHAAAEGNARAATVAALLDDRPRLQPALGMVHSSLLVLAVLFGTWAFSALYSGWPLLAAYVGLAAFAVFVGDIVPREAGRRHPASLAYRFSSLLRAGVTLGDAAADLVQDEDELEGDHDDPDDPDGDHAEEVELISSVLEFTDTIVREVMVPRPDMITVAGDSDAEQARVVVVEEGRSRIPVTGDGTDDILGILYARELLEHDTGAARTCVQLMRPAYFVPETKRVSDLLREMQAHRVHMAIVIDEFGGTAGLVTIEDLIEELVGEIADEYDVEEPMITPLADDAYLIDARLAIDDLEDLLGVDLPDAEWDTVGGLVLGLAGRIPSEGESFEYDGRVFTAERVQGRRISRVRVSS